MSTSVLEKALGVFRRGRELSAEWAEPFLDELIAETDEPVIATVFRAWNEKGIEESEIYEIARIMRERMTRVNPRHEIMVDIVGTGGSKAKTFNVSTAASFVVAGCGIPVAKHGNKAATSNSGSADVLSELNVNPAVDPETAEMCLNEIGICFMFAPNFHKLSATLGKVRRGLGFPTIFNCVGPLCNPASAPNQLIGVWDRSMVRKMAGALARLGTTRSWIVHGENGQDEISLSGRTFVAEVGEEVREFEITPEDFEIERFVDHGLRVGGPVESGAMIRAILSNNDAPAAAKGIVQLNAAAAIGIVDGLTTPKEAGLRAGESLRTGAAYKKLTELAEAAPV